MKFITHCCFAFLFSILIITATKAQSAYSMHTLATGETLSMLAKNYHTTVGDIMRMNGMNAQSQLHAGDKIKIPAGGTVVAEKPVPVKVSAPTAQINKPAETHVVAAGETLFHISQLYKMPVEKLITLNNLPDGNVKVGQTLIVSEGTVPLVSTKARTESGTAAPKEAPAQTMQNNPVVVVAPVVKQQAPSGNVVTETDSQKNNAATLPVTTPASASVITATDNSNSQAGNTYPSPVNVPKEGFFTSLYGKDVNARQAQTKSGSSMTFKSASGWADKKYYILMNDAPTGSIVKIKNGKNELYAKVLWSLGEMKENDGLAFRISTATAAALGITDQKFDLHVSYYE